MSGSEEEVMERNLSSRRQPGGCGASWRGQEQRGAALAQTGRFGAVLGLLGLTLVFLPREGLAGRPRRSVRKRAKGRRTQGGDTPEPKERMSRVSKARWGAAGRQRRRGAVARPSAETLRKARIAARLVSKTLARFGWEPSVRAVQRKALRHAGLSRPGITRARIRGAAVLPEFRIGVDLGRVQTSTSRQEAGSPVRLTERADSDRAWTMEARWRLQRLIFDPNELKLQAQSVRREELRAEILAQVTRLYFLRRRLQALEILQPARTVRRALARRLSIQRLTGELDSLTGGWFSAELRRRLSGK